MINFLDRTGDRGSDVDTGSVPFDQRAIEIDQRPSAALFSERCQDPCSCYRKSCDDGNDQYDDLHTPSLTDSSAVGAYPPPLDELPPVLP